MKLPIIMQCLTGKFTNFAPQIIDVSKEKRQKNFIQQPVFQGGPKGLTDFIYQNLKYPQEAFDANIEGVVLVDYDIDHKGNVVATRVLQGIGHGCDEEACRVVRLLKYVVGKNRGLNVLFHQKAKIQFKKPAPVQVVAPLPEQMEPSVMTQNAPQYQYSVTVTTTATTPQEAAPQQTAPQQTFTYTITINQ
jgi:TonB family protein